MPGLKVIIKVSDTENYEITEDSNLIEGFSISQQMDSNIAELVSDIECSETNIQLSNLFNEFNITQTTSLFSKVQNGQEVKVYHINSQNVQNQLFTGYIADFAAPTSSLTQSCTLRIVDRLQFVVNKDVSLAELNISKNITVGTYLVQLFTYLGFSLEDIVIDSSLDTIVLEYSLITGLKLSEQLNEICKAVDCYIFVNRYNKLIVKPKTISGSAVKTFIRDDAINNLKSTELAQSYQSNYNTLKVSYISTKMSEVQELLTLKGIVAQSGVSDITNYNLDKTNLYEIDSIKVSSSDGVYVDTATCTSSTISLTLQNDGLAEEIVDMVVYGKTVETADTFLVRKQDGITEEKSLEIKSVLMQTKQSAEYVFEKVWKRMQYKIPYITAEVECKDFTIELGMIIKIIDSEAEIEYEGYIHTLDLEYDGQGYAVYDVGLKMLDIIES